jgi:hypothetical protein
LLLFPKKPRPAHSPLQHDGNTLLLITDLLQLSEIGVFPWNYRQED